MTRRYGYAGAPTGALSYPAIPNQPELQAYLKRFSGTVSVTYRNALNQAIYRWKKAGVYALVQDLWLLCADTAADSLRNLITAARDAVVTGAPTFTPLQGFSGFDGGNYVGLPFSNTGVGANSGFAWAGSYNPVGPSTLMGAGAGQPGSITVIHLDLPDGQSAWGLCVGPAQRPSLVAVGNPSDSINGVAGAAGLNAISPTAVARILSGSIGAVTASPIRPFGIGMPRLLAYAVLPAATANQVRRFLGVLNTFLDDIGALA
jgi:hypothetical protein